MKILDGKKVRDAVREELAARVKKLSCVPKLALIQVGDVKESSIYIAQKMRFAESIGAKVLHMKFPADISQDDLLRVIASENTDEMIHGIIVQLPLPAHLDARAVMNAIHPSKDVDGLSDGSSFTPATAAAVLSILDFYKIPVEGRKAVVIGRSRLVGAPTAKLLSSRGAHVSVCHSQTPDVPAVARTADILVVAIGKPEHIGADSIQKGAAVVDVGINEIFDGTKRRLVGDVDHPSVEPLVGALTPVPGGVGPVTVACLFANLVRSAEEKCSG